MAESNFIDYVKILCRSGKGGAGSRHFHRAKYVPKGGPDGGDGGRGGHIFLRGNRNLWTLLHLRYQRHIFATNGESGGAGRSFGRDGEDRVIEVPIGTTVFDADTGEFLCEVVEDGQEVKLLRGGKGGLGNCHFATAANRAPRYAQPGQPAIEKAVVLELKLLGDVGLVGFPNAGKSTLLSAISAARPKIADYPFTTMEPSLGIVSYRDGKSFVMADIPGIIEGASEGRGLGLRFLRHIERNAVLLFMVSADTASIKDDYQVLLRELREFNPELNDKSRVLAVTKSDLLDDELREALSQELPDDLPVLFISSVTGDGLTELKDLLWREINSEQNMVASTITHRPLDVRHRVQEEDEFIFETEETDVDDMADMTDEDWNDEFWKEESSVNPDGNYTTNTQNIYNYETNNTGAGGCRYGMLNARQCIQAFRPAGRTERKHRD